MTPHLNPNPRYGGLTIDHPGAGERLAGASSSVALLVDRGLKSRKLDYVPLDEAALVKLADEATYYLAILYKGRPS